VFAKIAKISGVISFETFTQSERTREQGLPAMCKLAFPHTFCADGGDASDQPTDFPHICDFEWRKAA
jgi:hypothetical protein